MRKMNIEQVVGESKFNSLHCTVLFWCIILMIFDGYDLVVYGSVIPSLMGEWGIKPTTAGFIGSLTLIGNMTGALIGGPLADNVGRKKVIIFSTVIFSIFTLLCGFASGPSMFGTFRFFAGIGLGAIQPLLITITSEYAPKSVRNMLVGIMFSGYSLGGITVALLGMNIIPNLGWEWMFFVGAIPILFVPLLIMYLPESISFLAMKGKHKEVSNILRRLNKSYIPQENDFFEIDILKKSGFSISELFKERRGRTTIMFWLAFFMGLLMVYGLNTWLPQLMVQEGYPLQSSLLFLFSLNVGAIVGSVCGGWLADRIGAKRVLISYFTLGAICLTLLGLKPSILLVYLLIAIAGLATMGSQNINNAYISTFYPTNIRSTGVGWALGIGRIGAILGPTMGGVLLELNLPFVWNFISFAIPAIFATMAIIFIQDNYSDLNKYKELNVNNSSEPTVHNMPKEISTID